MTLDPTQLDLDLLASVAKRSCLNEEARGPTARCVESDPPLSLCLSCFARRVVPDKALEGAGQERPVHRERDPRELALRARDRMVAHPTGEPVTVIAETVTEGMAAQKSHDTEVCQREAEAYRRLQRRHRDAGDRVGAAQHGITASAIEYCIACMS